MLNQPTLPLKFQLSEAGSHQIQMLAGLHSFNANNPVLANRHDRGLVPYDQRRRFFGERGFMHQERMLETSTPDCQMYLGLTNKAYDETSTNMADHSSKRASTFWLLTERPEEGDGMYERFYTPYEAFLKDYKIPPETLYSVAMTIIHYQLVSMYHWEMGLINMGFISPFIQHVWSAMDTRSDMVYYKPEEPAWAPVPWGPLLDKANMASIDNDDDDNNDNSNHRHYLDHSYLAIYVSEFVVINSLQMKIERLSPYFKSIVNSNLTFNGLTGKAKL